jgi:hypothetical protein
LKDLFSLLDLEEDDGNFVAGLAFVLGCCIDWGPCFARLSKGNLECPI